MYEFNALHDDLDHSIWQIANNIVASRSLNVFMVLAHVLHAWMSSRNSL